MEVNAVKAVPQRWAWLYEAARDHWLSLLILVAPIIWVVYQADKAENVIPMLPLPIVAFGIGLLLRPRHDWLVWLGAVVIEWITVIVWGKYNDPGDETLMSIMIEAFFWMFFGVFIPVWLGRSLRSLIGAKRPPALPPAR